jgi:hypothetical protein
VGKSRAFAKVVRAKKENRTVTKQLTQSAFIGLILLSEVAPYITPNSQDLDDPLQRRHENEINLRLYEVRGGQFSVFSAPSA